MKLARIIDERLHVALNKLSKEALPLKTAFKLKGIIKAIQEEYAKYDEVRKDALQRHGEKNKDGSLKIDERQNVVFSGDSLAAFAKDMADLTNMEVNISTVTLAELGDNIKITIEDVEMLEDIITLD